MSDLNVTFSFSPDDDSTLYVSHDCPVHPFDGEPPYRRKMLLPLEPIHGWTRESKNGEALTITPSILSYCCGMHGFITNGRWEEANEPKAIRDNLFYFVTGAFDYAVRLRGTGNR